MDTRIISWELVRIYVTDQQELRTLWYVRCGLQ